PDGAMGGGGAMFLAMNRNKLGMTLDPGSPKGREITKKLVASADVVVANLPPSVLRSLSLDLDSLRETKPDIILTTVTGFGAGGPLSHKHGFDGIGQAMSGAVYLSGHPELPTMTKVPWVDFGTAFLSAFGTLAALIERGSRRQHHSKDERLVRRAKLGRGARRARKGADRRGRSLFAAAGDRRRAYPSRRAPGGAQLSDARRDAAIGADADRIIGDAGYLPPAGAADR